MIQKLLEVIKNHPKLVVAQDFEVACQKIGIKKQQYINGSCGVQSVDESYWVQLKVLHRNKPGIAIAAAVTDQTPDRLVAEALLSAEQSTPDPWFRFPVWSARSEGSAENKTEGSPENFWDSSKPLLRGPDLTFQERYEWWDVETLLFRRSEKIQKRWKRSTGYQQWNLGKCLDAFWGLENREHRLRSLEDTAVSVEQSAKWQGATPKTISLSSRAMSPLLQQVARWFQANLIQDKTSIPNFSKLVTLFDDSDQIPTPHSGPFDLDGIATQKTVLIKNGIFSGVLYDAYFGAIENCRSTGNRIRGLYELEPQLRAKAVCLEAGQVSPSEFWKKKGSGLALEGWTGLDFLSEHQVEGDAYGWRMENGVAAQPVHIDGLKLNLKNVMNHILFVGNDPKAHGFSLSPTVVTEGAL